MQLRFSTCVGMPVLTEDDHTMIGAIEEIILHPDTGKVEGFFAVVAGFLRSDRMCLASADICRFGRAVEVRDAAMLGPLEEHVRLTALLQDPRRIMGQQVVTEDGQTLGRCRDVQFDTERFSLEWLFPRRWTLKWGVPVPAHAIVDVRRDAVVVKSTYASLQKQESSVAEIVASPTVA